MKTNKLQSEWITDSLANTVELKPGAVAVQLRKDKDVLWTIVHEAVHVWQLILDYMQEENPGKEAEAYTIEHIARTMYQQYLKLEKPDAIHEERKARLQKRVSVGTQEQTKPGEGSS